MPTYSISEIYIRLDTIDDMASFNALCFIVGEEMEEYLPDEKEAVYKMLVEASKFILLKAMSGIRVRKPGDFDGRMV